MKIMRALLIIIVVMLTGMILFWTTKDHLYLDDRTTEENFEILPSTEWQTYESGKKVKGFSIDVPDGWVVNHRRSSHDRPDIEARIYFAFIPYQWEENSPWGGIYLDVYNYQVNIEQWIDEYLPEYKNDLTVTQKDYIKESSVFVLTSNRFLVPHNVILGNKHSYVYGFGQEGKENFIDDLYKEIFPRINID